MVSSRNNEFIWMVPFYVKLFDLLMMTIK